VTGSLAHAEISEKLLQFAAAVHDSHYFNFIDDALIAVRMCFVKDEVRPLNEHARFGLNFRTPHTDPRRFDQQCCFGLHSVKDAFRRRRIVETDVQVDFNQIFAGLRSPDKFNLHVPRPP